MTAFVEPVARIAYLVAQVYNESGTLSQHDISPKATQSVWLRPSTRNQLVLSCILCQSWYSEQTGTACIRDLRGVRATFETVKHLDRIDFVVIGCCLHRHHRLLL